MPEEHQEKIEDAIEYADSSNAIENNGLEESEIQKIMNDIQTGKSDESFLYSVVKLVKKREEGQRSGPEKR